MRRRHAYVLMFALPGLIAALIAAAVVFAGLAGALWIFVFGDKPWPGTADAVLVAAFAAVGAAVWIALMRLAYHAGRREEGKPDLNRRHVAAALGGTAALAAVVVLHQWSVGNIGTPSDSLLCSDFCRAQGYSGSSIPPRDSGRDACGCLAADGRLAAEAPLAGLRAGRQSNPP